VTVTHYLIKKYGDGYWRPKSCGYTNSVLEAGLYTEAEAAQFQDKKSDHSYAVPVDEGLKTQIRQAVDRLNHEVLALVELSIADTA
jgi:16S rRNA U516 pseudouridylate synthase RsuA-like enzyme